MIEEKNFYTIEETAELLGISEKELKKLIEDKKIPVLEVGRALRISGGYIDNFFKENKSGDNIEYERDGFVERNLKEVFEGDIEKEVEEGYGQKGEVRDINPGIEHLKEECEALIEKKQELEEEINYLQMEYDEFRNKMRKLVVEELKIFLKKIDNKKIDLEERSFK
jgi:excisionase family DNA binding protein